MINFLVLCVFFTSTHAGVFYYPSSSLCSDGSTSSTEDSGYDKNVLVIDGDVYSTFAFDANSCFSSLSTPYLLFKGKVNVIFNQLLTIYFPNFIGGLLFEENCEITFSGEVLGSFYFGDYGYYEFRKEANVTHDGVLTVSYDLKLGNSSTLNVNGPIENYGVFTIDESVVNVYQFGSYGEYSSQSSSHGNDLMGYFSHSSSTLTIINGEINIYGSTYSDTDSIFNGLNNGIYIRSSDVDISEDSIIRIYPVEDANYPINFVIDDTSSLTSYISIDNSQIIADNVTLCYSNITGNSIITSDAIILNNNVILNEESTIKTNSTQINGILEMNELTRIETIEYNQQGNLIINDESTIIIKGDSGNIEIGSSYSIETSKTIENSPIFQIENGGITINIQESSISTTTNCFDLISSFTTISNEMSYLNEMCNGKLLRYCPTTNENEVICEFNGEIWSTTFTITTNPFNYYHCMNNCEEEDCYIKSNSSFITIGDEMINVTFINNNVTLYFNEITTKEQNINSNSIGYSSLKSNSYLNTIKQSIEIIESNILIFTIDNEQFDINNMKCEFGIIEGSEFYCLTSYECDYGYYMNNKQCHQCDTNCKVCNSTDNCYLCKDNYTLENGICVDQTSNCLKASRNYCNICGEGLTLNGNTCSSNCDNNCITCNSNICYICNSTININGECNNINNSEILSNNSVISCLTSYYNTDGICETCSSIDSNCNNCSNSKCIECLNGYYLNNNTCESMHCLDSNSITNGTCDDCENGYFQDSNGKCVESIENCLLTNNGECQICDNDLIVTSFSCTEEVEHCLILSTKCLRCSNGYYLNEFNECSLCNSSCLTCYNETYCLSCSSNTYLSEGECITNSELELVCNKYSANGGCVECKDGYYRNGFECVECLEECGTCNNGENCLTCNSTNYQDSNSQCVPKSTIIGCAVEITSSGCSECEDGYFSLDNSCSECSEHSKTCTSLTISTSCQNDYILINNNCTHYNSVEYCNEASDSKCSSCSFWHTPSDDGTFCSTQAEWWVIVLLLLLVILVIAIVLIFSIWGIRKLVKVKINNNQPFTIFSMDNSNVQFNFNYRADKLVVGNKETLLFDDDDDSLLPVNEERKELICIGNMSKYPAKIQFTTSTKDNYELRINPQVVLLKTGKACEFEIFIKPLCTCKINDQISIVSDIFKLDESVGYYNLKIIAETVITTKLDYNELTEDIKLGEGSFGIVYKGTFRGNQVAIKKMKQFNKPEQMEEFNKEVAMLDKFRNDYIVHFYGAVFIPNKICMVTEFAQYGSLQDLMNKRRDNPIDDAMKIKILLDCSKGISYLHVNGILHRDIKPDNFLILSLDTNVTVNAKLTDFGSSRNINMLMTNMTFTKGIGTPKFMAPEILDRKKYKKPADIYSFALTMYETMTWSDAYPNSKFKYPWDVAEFVSKGERLSKPDTMNETMYSLIDNCWKQEPKERYEIEEVIEKLEEMD